MMIENEKYPLFSELLPKQDIVENVKESSETPVWRTLAFYKDRFERNMVIHLVFDSTDEKGNATLIGKDCKVYLPAVEVEDERGFANLLRKEHNLLIQSIDGDVVKVSQKAYLALEEAKKTKEKVELRIKQLMKKQSDKVPKEIYFEMKGRAMEEARKWAFDTQANPEKAQFVIKQRLTASLRERLEKEDVKRCIVSAEVINVLQNRAYLDIFGLGIKCCVTKDNWFQTPVVDLRDHVFPGMVVDVELLINYANQENRCWSGARVIDENPWDEIARRNLKRGDNVRGKIVAVQVGDTQKKSCITAIIDGLEGAPAFIYYPQNWHGELRVGDTYIIRLKRVDAIGHVLIGELYGRVGEQRKEAH